MTAIYAIASVVLVSLVSFIGVLSMSLSQKWLRALIIVLVSFSAGALLGDAFLHLLPEAVEVSGFTLAVSIGILAGIVFSFIMEKFIHWHHCHTPGEHHHHPVGYINLFGDAVHNFLDGIIIGASYLVSIEVGVATTLAVILHEIPQELGDFGVLLHAGFSRTKALLFNFLTALAAIAGVVITMFLAQAEAFALMLVPFAAGNFIYIACADIIPELHKEVKTSTSVKQFSFFLLGIVFMALLLLLE
jgi:zinc and cadmium transporter